MASKASRASKVSIRQSKVSFAAQNDTVVNYYHSKHSEDPPAPRISKRISLTYLEEPVITVYNQQDEKGDAAEGDEEGGGETRKFMHKYKDAPIKEEKIEPTFAQKLRAVGQKLNHYKAMKCIQICCAIYIAVFTLAPIGGLRVRGGTIIDPASDERTRRGVFLVEGNLRAIICQNTLQLVFIGVTRISAYMMYPALVLVYMTKFRATMAYLSRSNWWVFTAVDFHELHVYCGWTVFIDCTIHSVLHCARWGNQGNMYLLFHHPTGLTGFIVFFATLLICVPMTFLRLNIIYEIRKNMHYLFILFGLGMSYHAPANGVPNGGYCAYIFPILLGWWLLDWMYCFVYMTEKIDTTGFEVLPNGVQLSMGVSDRFMKNGAQGGYAYVCLPWVDRTQWHAFSLFEDPVEENERQIFMQCGGDWTRKVHKILQRDTVRPCYIQGPFPSPYNLAEDYDNQILVASGIGITPALSVIRAHKGSRKINLIWSVRDRHLLEFFLRHLYLDHSGWNLIFYTGKDPLPEDAEIFTNSNLSIILGRPRLKQLIPSIIYGMEAGHGKPEDYNPEIRSDDIAGFSDIIDSVHPDKEDAVSEEVEAAIKAAAQKRDSSGLSFRPWENHPEASEYVSNLPRKEVLSTWGMMYCGGAQAVLEDLENISKKYDIDVHIESFGW